MSVGVSTVESSNPSVLTTAANELGTKITSIESALADQRSALARLRVGWQGDAAEAAIAKAEQDINAQEDVRNRLLAVKEALATGGANLQSARDGLLRIIGPLRATGWSIDDDGTAHAPLIPTFAKLLEPAFTALIKRMLDLFDRADQQTSSAITSAMGESIPTAPPGTSGDPRRLPSEDASPEDVKAWWDSLMPDEQQALIDDHRPEMGNLNGIPADVRDQVNQQVMNDDLDRVRDVAGRYDVSEDEVIANPGLYGLTQQDVTRFYNARRTSEGLAHQRGTDPNRQRPVMLWGYDPMADNGQGRAAITIGNPDTARNTAVVVPGTGSSVRDGWLADGHNDAINIYDQSALADPNNPTAVMMWMGYDAPDGFTDLRIANPELARTGGDLLAADVNGLSSTHVGSSHVTVMGHSYGSTTVADAFAGSGMRADDAVLLGCPGTDLAKSAADFHLPEGGQVYVGAASTDPVSWIGNPGDIPADYLNQQLGFPLGLDAGLGTDPAGDEYGSVRFDAEVAGRDGFDTNDHSHYYDKGSESLRAMTEIVSGHADRLDDNGLLAEGRRQPHITTPDHIPLPFGIDLPIPHIDSDIPGSPAFIDPEADRPGSSVTLDHDYKPGN